MMKITKEQIIEALRTEPLGVGGAFVKYDEDREVFCVCAVGAVINKYLNVSNLELFNHIALNLTNDVPVADPESVNEEIQFQLEKGNYFTALSMFFEDYFDKKEFGYTEELADEHNTGDHFYVLAPRNRRAIYNFVEKHFPDEVEINDAIV